MAKVVTLTPNPALDIAAHVQKMSPSHKLRCGPVRRDPGGGGINVARALHRFGQDVVAVYACGGGAGLELRELLVREGMQERAISVLGHTRESFNITEDQSGSQFRFILPGDPMSETEWQSCMDVSLSLMTSGCYFVGSGSLPPGVPDDFYARVARSAKARGAKTVIDTQGRSLTAVLEEGVDILKASAREMGEYLGSTPLDPEDWRDSCRVLLQSGRARVVVVTLGERGAVLVTKTTAYYAAVPKVRSLTTVGAGDSFLGGLIAKIVEGNSLKAALQFGAAAGTAALFTHGTGLCEPAEVEKLNAKLTVREL